MSDLSVDVVKRQGKRPNEPFDPGKLYASIYAVCISTGSPDGLAHDAATKHHHPPTLLPRSPPLRVLRCFPSPRNPHTPYTFSRG